MNIFSSTYNSIRYSQFVWSHILNKEARAYWDRNKKPHFFHGQSVITSLKKDGIVISHVNEIFGPEFFMFLQEFTQMKLSKEGVAHIIENQRKSLLQKIEAGGLKKKEKDFFVWLWSQQEKEPLDFANPFIRMVLDEKVLGIVGNYLGLAPRLSIFSLILTLVMPSGSQAYLSQRWHRDPDDKKLIKMFVYLTDVEDEGSGPFKYVKESHLGGRWRHLFPQKPPAGSYPPEGELEKLIPKEYFVTCTGKAGTVIFCDTSGFHKGGFCTAKERIMFTSAFITDGSPYPLYHEIAPSMDLEKVSPLALYALHKE